LRKVLLGMNRFLDGTDQWLTMPVLFLMMLALIFSTMVISLVSAKMHTQFLSKSYTSPIVNSVQVKTPLSAQVLLEEIRQLKQETRALLDDERGITQDLSLELDKGLMNQIVYEEETPRYDPFSSVAPPDTETLWQLSAASRMNLSQDREIQEKVALKQNSKSPLDG